MAWMNYPTVLFRGYSGVGCFQREERQPNEQNGKHQQNP
jgi:hypothetical protein